MSRGDDPWWVGKGVGTVLAWLYCIVALHLPVDVVVAVAVFVTGVGTAGVPAAHDKM